MQNTLNCGLNHARLKCKDCITFMISYLCLLFLCLPTRNIYWATPPTKAAPWMSITFWMKVRLKWGIVKEPRFVPWKRNTTWKRLISVVVCFFKGISQNSSLFPAGHLWVWLGVIPLTRIYQRRWTRWRCSLSLLTPLWSVIVSRAKATEQCSGGRGGRRVARIPE